MVKNQLNAEIVRRRLEKTVSSYALHSVVQKEIAHRVLERLDYIKQTPRRILDMSLHGVDSESLLRQRFPKASYIAAMPFMAGLQQRKSRWFRTLQSLCMPFDCIPLQAASVDFIFMNLRLLWSNDWPLLLRECRRVLMPKGMLLLTSLGPDTLIELKQAFMGSKHHSAVHTFVDMHDIGDVLLGAGFENPVMDMERIVMQYPSLASLTTDLRLTGAQCAQQHRSLGLTTPKQWQFISEHYKKNESAGYPATFEVIYGHAWAGERLPQKTTEMGEVLISLENLKKGNKHI